MKASLCLSGQPVPTSGDAPGKKPRRSFDRDTGVIAAKALFHEHGYDAVGIADLTRVLDINPPSLYAAFGSKAGLFDRCIKNYVEEVNLPVDRILSENKLLSDAIYDLFITAAKQYAKSPRQRGCMVTEGMRADGPQARSLASKYGNSIANYIEQYIQRHCPSRARELSDFVVTTLRGLSAAAQLGLPKIRLLAVAKLAGESFQSIFTLSNGKEKS